MINRQYKRSKIVYSGIITNYNCTAKCRHCMFMSSPECKKDFISEEASVRIAKKLADDGAMSVHIGGGEPFITFKALCTLLKYLREYGVGIDYIETNAFWCSDENIISGRLNEIKKLGVSCVMASVDPFHIEFVPLARPLLLCRMLEKHGMEYFIWQEKFLRRLIKLDHSRTYSSDELKEILGENYITDTAKEYGLGINGRALNIADEIYMKRLYTELIKEKASCVHMLSGQHCHVDLYENVIPSGCPGISIELDDFLSSDRDGSNLNKNKYPVVFRLISGGLGELYHYAEKAGFKADESGYSTACALCADIRCWLNKNLPSQDIAPDCFYDELI